MLHPNRYLVYSILLNIPTARYLEQLASSKNMLPPPDASEPTVQATALIDDTFAHHFFVHPSPTPDDEPEFQFPLETVADNLKLHTKREQKDAKLARIAFHGLKLFSKEATSRTVPFFWRTQTGPLTSSAQTAVI